MKYILRGDVLASVILECLAGGIFLGIRIMEFTSYGLYIIIIDVSWIVEIGHAFEPEFDNLHEDVRTEILALTRVLQQFGPQLGRPRVDTLNAHATRI